MCNHGVVREDGDHTDLSSACRVDALRAAGVRPDLHSLIQSSNLRAGSRKKLARQCSIRDNGERTMEESEQWRGEERQRCRRDRDQRRRPVPRVTDPNIDHDRPLQSEPVLKTSKNLWKTWERTPRSRESELGGRGPCARCCRTAWSADELATLSHVERLKLKIQWSI